MPVVLLIEDQADIRETLEAYLKRDNYRCETASDGTSGWQLFLTARPDLVLLDIQLPGLDGLELLRRIRAQGHTPVIMLTARSTDLDKLLGLELGADDYITKPFSARELMARVKAVLRRNRLPQAQHLLRIGPLDIDVQAVSASVGGERLDLTLSEFRLLKQLAQAPGRVFSRSELMEAALPNSEALERAIDVHIKNLRKKLEALGGVGWLRTVRGLGYSLSVEE